MSMAMLAIILLLLDVCSRLVLATAGFLMVILVLLGTLIARDRRWVRVSGV